MSEEEKKLFIFTQMNTKINAGSPDNTEFYVNKGKIDLLSTSGDIWLTI
jgi:hypothetical protein